jgi:hypothetical protein
MTANVGTFDRVARFALGVLLVLAPFVGNLALFQSTLATVLAVIVGAVMIVTASMRFCPLYRVLGIRTCRL